MVELTLVNEQSVEDLKLLIKVSYGPNYIEDDGVLIDIATRLRLLPAQRFGIP